MRKTKEAIQTLSTREMQVLTLVSEGKSNTQIGKELHISPHTVKAYIKGIFDKFGVRDRICAVVVAMRKKLLF